MISSKGFGQPTEFQRKPACEIDAPGGEIGSLIGNKYEKEYIDDAKNVERFYYEKA